MQSILSQIKIGAFGPTKKNPRPVTAVTGVGGWGCSMDGPSLVLHLGYLYCQWPSVPEEIVSYEQ